jgi:ABC-type transport system involved in cytochrome c biogenesis permease subunit
MSAALSETIAYVNRSRSFMPPGTPGAFVTRFDAGSVPVGNLVFSTENPTRTVGQMQDAALNMVRPLFATLPGVSAPPPFGGSARTILINVKPDRLRAYGLSPDDVVKAMTEANTMSPSGNLALPNSFPIVPTNAVVKNIQDLAAVPLKVTDKGAVYVRDIGEVSDGSDLMTSIAIVNGKRTVYMPVTKRSDASTLSVVELVKANIPKFKAACPEDIHVTFEFDQSPWIIHAIEDLVKEGLLGAALTGLMVLLFLRDLRSAFIVILNIPIAITGLVFQCLFLQVRGEMHGRCPITNGAEVLVFVSWSIVIMYLALGRAFRLSLLGVFSMPIIFLFQLFAILYLAIDDPGPRPPAQLDPWLELHAAMSLLAYGAFGLAGIAGVMYLVQDRQLKSHQPGRLFYSLPPIRYLSVALVRLLAIGTLLLSVGIIAAFFILAVADLLLGGLPLLFLRLR